MFVVNSRLGFSSVAGSSSKSKSLHQLRPSFSRSYGCILPSSLTRVFPRTLGFSPRLPVSVLVRVHVVSLEAFLGSVVRLNLTCTEVRVYLSVLSLTERQPTAFDWHFQSPAQTPCCVTPSSNNFMQYRNFRLLSIAYACCLGLGPDLPWDDERCPGSLRLSVGQILTDRFATHTGILTSIRSLPMLAHAATSVLYLSPGYFRRRASRPVSYYALFKWWLLLSQHPGCLGSPTSFST